MGDYFLFPVLYSKNTWDYFTSEFILQSFCLLVNSRRLLLLLSLLLLLLLF